MKEIFIEKVPSYELRDGGNICLPKVKTMRFGTETVRFLGQKLWRTLSADIKDSESLSVFKEKSKRTRLVVTADYASDMWKI